jgi:hypothetical protein
VPSAIRNAFGEVVQFAYSQGINKFYRAKIDSGLVEKVKKVIEGSSKLQKRNLDIDAFNLYYLLWRTLNIESNQFTLFRKQLNLRFPLLPCSKIIPYQNAVWNMAKGPSDTTTKLIDSRSEQLGVRTPQSVAVARMFLVLAVNFHRSIQLMTAKDLGKYVTLQHYRANASHRQSFKKSLELLVRFAKEEIGLVLVRGNVDLTTLFTSPERRSNLRNGDKALKVPWIDPIPLGVTPTRGRGRSRMSATASRDYEMRNGECQGVTVVRLVDGKGNWSKGKCDLCGFLTPWYCTGCKRSLCLDKVRDVSNPKKKQKIVMNEVIGPETQNVKPGTIIKMGQLKQQVDQSVERKYIRAILGCFHCAHYNQINSHFLDKHYKKVQETGNGNN